MCKPMYIFRKYEKKFGKIEKTTLEEGIQKTADFFERKKVKK